MKRGAGGIAQAVMVAVVLTVGTAGVGRAQQLGNSGGGAQPGGSYSAAGAGSGAGAAAGAGIGLGAGRSPTPGVGASPGMTYGTGSAGAGPALNNMRANGTALYMNPDPRAPNVSGRAAPLR